MMCSLSNIKSKMKKLHRTVSDKSELNHTALSQNLEKTQLKALDDCAGALQSIIDLHAIVTETKQPTPRNVLDAKNDLRDAMVNLAIVASRGGGYAKVKEILAGYGLEDIF